MVAVRFQVIAILFLSLIKLQAQEPFYRNYTSSSGLPSSEVYNSIQDDKGYIWFSTDHGISRFDGYQFRNYDIMDGLPENATFYFRADKKGRIWFSTFSGLLGYIEDGNVYPYTHNKSLKKFIADNSIVFALHEHFRINEDNSIDLIFDMLGSYTIDHQGNISKNTTISDSSTIHIENYWDEYCMILLPPGKNHTHIKIPFLKTAANFHIEPYKTVKASHDYQWAVRSSNGIYYYSKKHTIFAFHNDSVYFVHQTGHPILDIGLDKTGKLWVCTVSGGVFIFDEQLTLLERIFSNITITSFLQDHEGGIWLTSLNKGVFYIPDINSKIYNRNSGLKDDNIISITTDKDGRLWYANNHLNIGYIFANKAVSIELSIDETLAIQSIHGDLHRPYIWIATNRGLFYYNYENELLQSYEYYHNNSPYFVQFGVKTIDQDPITKVIWLGTFNGIRCIDSNFKMQADLMHFKSFSNRVESLTISENGSVWIGSSKGLYQFDGNEYINYGKKHPLLSERITALCEVDGVLWAGTRGKGLLRFTGDTLFQYTIQDGMPSNSVSSITLHGGHIVAGTNMGIALVYPRNNNQGYVIHPVTAGSGLAVNEVQDIISHGTKLVTATTAGLSMLKRGSRDQQFEMPIHITAVKSDGKLIDFIQPFTLPFRSNNLSIDFFAISFVKIGKHTYRHRLIGLEENWVVDQKTTAQYPYLLPGKYRFIVEVQHQNGSWSSHSASFDFQILTPFWLRWWFIFIIVLVALSLLFFIFSLVYRVVNQRKKLVQELNQYHQEALANQMNPHFLFNALNTVNRYILENDKVSSSKYLTKFAGLMRTMLANAQLREITLSNEIASISLYLDLEAARFKNRFEYRIRVDASVDTDQISIPVYLLQPLAENAIWHGLIHSSREGYLEISIGRNQQDLLCKVTDNGIGRKASAVLRQDSQKKSLGISIIRKRLSLINANDKTNIRLEYEDLTDEHGEAAGTVATLIFPNWL